MEGPGDESAALALLRIGRRLDLFRDPAGTVYATDYRRTLAPGSTDFRRLLIGRYHAETGRPRPPAAVKQAGDTLDALAGGGPCRPMHVRFAAHAGRSYLNPADAADAVLEVDADGWRACEAPPVRFVRRSGMGPVPVPARGGDLAALRRFVDVPDPDAFVLVLAFLAAAVRGVGAYPLLVLTGEAAGAKTTNFIKGLVDPAAEPDAPADVKDLMVIAAHYALPAFGNLSGLSREPSNGFARLAACRPVILNGITDFVTAGDLCSRGLFVRLPPIPAAARQDLADLAAEYEAARPALLGALLDRAAAGLRTLPLVALAESPRMAGFARFAVACELGGGRASRTGSRPPMPRPTPTPGAAPSTGRRSTRRWSAGSATGPPGSARRRLCRPT